MRPSLRSPTPRHAAPTVSLVVGPQLSQPASSHSTKEGISSPLESESSQSVFSRGRGIGIRRSRFDNVENSSNEVKPTDGVNIMSSPAQPPGSGRGIAFALARTRLPAIGAGLRPPESMQQLVSAQTNPPLKQDEMDPISVMLRSIRNSCDSTTSYKPRPWEINQAVNSGPVIASTDSLETNQKSETNTDNQMMQQIAPLQNSSSLSSQPQMLKSPVKGESSNKVDQKPAAEEVSVPSSFSSLSKYVGGSNDDSRYLALLDVPLDAHFSDVVAALPTGVRLSRYGIKYEADTLRRRTGHAFIRLLDPADQRRCLTTKYSGVHVRQSCEHEFFSVNDPTLSDEKLAAEIGGPLPNYPPRPSPYHDDCCLEISGLPKPILRDDLISIFGESAVTDPDNDIFIDQSKCHLTATAYVRFSLNSSFQTALESDAGNIFPGASICAISKIQFREYAKISRKVAASSPCDVKSDFRLTREQRQAGASGARSYSQSAGDSAADDAKLVCVEVQNLPSDTTTQELRDFFHPLLIERDAIHLIVRGVCLQAFVQFAEPKSAAEAVSKNNGRKLRGAPLDLRVRSLGQRKEALAALSSSTAAGRGGPTEVDEKRSGTRPSLMGPRPPSQREPSPPSSKSSKRNRRRSRSKRSDGH